MKNNDLNWAKLHDEEDETSSKAKTPINVSKIHEKDLFLIVCNALKAGTSKTKTNHEKTVYAEAIKSMVEVIVRKFDCPIVNLKEAIEFLSAVTERKEEEQDESDSDNKKSDASSGSS